jgi:hypothetical protein
VNNSKFGKTLSEIAANAGVTRASLSKSLLSLRDGAGLSLTIGKRAYARDSYKRSQAAALKAGVHVSQVRKKKLASA